MSAATLELTAAQARALALAAQGLLARPRRRARKQDVLGAIRRMGALQIDSIHVVARSPYLVLWSRLGDYRPEWLDELLAEDRIFEYWAHEASFLPIEHYALMRHRMLSPERQGWHYRAAWMEEHRDDVAAIMAYIREHGAVRSADFEGREGPKRGGWWGWKIEKRALEYLFTAGELMIVRRDGFQRVYDLRERVHPEWDDARALPEDEAEDALALESVRALGVAKAAWVADYYRMGKRQTPARVRRLADAGELVRASVEGWSSPGYLHPSNVELAQRAAAGRLRPRLTTLLSPFDPVVWDRRRTREMFGFDYRLECYTPAAKRRFGYYVLPILRRDRLIGRLDAKAHRRDGVFEVKALYLEDGVRVTDRLAADVAGALRECAGWHGTPEVVVRGTEPAGLSERLRIGG